MPECQCLTCLWARARRKTILAWAAVWESEMEVNHG